MNSIPEFLYVSWWKTPPARVSSCYYFSLSERVAEGEQPLPVAFFSFYVYIPLGHCAFLFPSGYVEEMTCCQLMRKLLSSFPHHMCRALPYDRARSSEVVPATTPLFHCIYLLLHFLRIYQVTKRSSTGLLAAAFTAIVPSYISRSVGGSYDNEGVAIFALIFVFYLWIKSVNTGSMMWSCLTVSPFRVNVNIHRLDGKCFFPSAASVSTGNF